jgi:hypothetical protein
VETDANPSCGYSNAVYQPGNVIPDGQGGVIALWGKITNNAMQETSISTHTMSHINNGTTTSYPLPYSVIGNNYGAPSIQSGGNVVLGDNGIVFATDNTESVVTEPVLFAVDSNSGAVKWTYEQSVDQIRLIASSYGGGVVAKSTTSGVDTVLRFDSSGNVTPDGWNASQIHNFGGSLWQGGLSSGSPVSGFYAAPVALDPVAYSRPDGIGGNVSAQDFAVTGFSQSGPNQTTIMGLVQELIAAFPSTTLPGSPGCYAWLQSGNEGTKALFDLNLLYVQQNPQGWGHGTVVFANSSQVDYNTIAFSGNSNPDHTPVSGVPNNVATTVNDPAGFFNANYPSGKPYYGAPYFIGTRRYRGGTFLAQAATLVHEMGHAVIGEPNFQQDLQDTAAGRANDALVNTNCGVMIGALPSITGLSQTSGALGTVVTITGTNFGAMPGTVTFNGVAATPTNWNNSSIVTPVPPQASTGNVIVTVSGSPAGIPTTGAIFTVQ